MHVKSGLKPPVPARIRKYDAWIERRGFWAAASLRAVFLMHPLLHAAFGLSRIRFVSYILGSALGYLPSLAVVVWASAGVLDTLKGQPFEIFALALVVVVSAIALLRIRAARRRDGAIETVELSEPRDVDR